MRDDDDALPAYVAEWAVEAARATVGARLASRVAVGLSVFVVVGGVVAAIAQASQQWSFGAGQAIGSVASTLITTAFWAGLLLVAGMLLRLQAARFDLDIADGGSEMPVDEAAG